MSANRFTKVTIAVMLMLLPLTVMAVRAHAESKPYSRTMESYSLPDVVLVNQEGKKVRFKSIVESNKPVVVDFIYGTCTTICPVLSAGFTNLQQKLGNESEKIHLVSISIDPENDTPKVMKDYLKRYRAKAGWDFLTGSRSDIDLILKSFNSNFRSKMDHKPLTFIHAPGEAMWIRIFGLISSSEFVEECRKAGIK